MFNIRIVYISFDCLLSSIKELSIHINNGVYEWHDSSYLLFFFWERFEMKIFNTIEYIDGNDDTFQMKLSIVNMSPMVNINSNNNNNK